MRALEKRAEYAADQALHKRLRELETELRTQLPSAQLEVFSDRIEVRGEGLLRRWLGEASLRFMTRGHRS